MEQLQDGLAEVAPVGEMARNEVAEATLTVASNGQQTSEDN
jgi:hypothetical protein